MATDAIGVRAHTHNSGSNHGGRRDNSGRKPTKASRVRDLERVKRPPKILNLTEERDAWRVVVDKAKESGDLKTLLAALTAINDMTRGRPHVQPTPTARAPKDSRLTEALASLKPKRKAKTTPQTPMNTGDSDE